MFRPSLITLFEAEQAGRCIYVNECKSHNLLLHGMRNSRSADARLIAPPREVLRDFSPGQKRTIRGTVEKGRPLENKTI